MSVLTRLLAGVFEFVRVALLRRTGSEFLWFGLVAVLSVGAAFGADQLFSALGFNPVDLLAEDGPIETAQAYVVTGGTILFLVAAIRYDYELFYGSIFAALMSALILRREIPGCREVAGTSDFCLVDGQKSTMLLVICVVFVAVMLVKRIPLARHLNELNFFWMVPLGYGVLLLGSAELSERLHIERFEETLETSAYLVLIVFAIVLNWRPDWFDVRRYGPLIPAARDADASGR